MHDLSPPPITRSIEERGSVPRRSWVPVSRAPRENSRGRRGRGRARRNHRPGTTAITDTVTLEPPTARHTVPAAVGTYEDCAEHTPALHHRVDRGQDALSTVPRSRVGAKPTDRRKLDHELVELRCHGAARRTAPRAHPAGTTRRPRSSGPSVARPIPTSSRPVHRPAGQPEPGLGPVGPAGQALLAAGRVGDGDMAARTPTPPRSARPGDFPASAQ